MQILSFIISNTNYLFTYLLISCQVIHIYRYLITFYVELLSLALNWLFILGFTFALH